jgi:transcriptional regulator with XRE-family HTH domain
MTGQELRIRRQELGLTQEGLAKELDVTANTVARWERGEVPKGGGDLPSWVEKVLPSISQLLAEKKQTK